MTIWNVVRIAATKIPWGVVAEHAPSVIDLVRARGRQQVAPQTDELEETLIALTTENERLSKALAQVTARLQDAQRRVDAVYSRQFTLTALGVLSLILSLSAFIIAALR